MARPKYNEVSLKDKKNFAKYLSEDEELIIATGFGKTFLRQHFILQMVIPWGFWMLVGLGYAYFTKSINPGVAMLYGMGISAIFSYLQTLYIYNANRYLLTTRRVIFKKGILSVKMVSALYDKITHIEMDQSLYDRLFLKHGTITIHTAGSEKDELVLRYVENPIEFKNILERMINRERERYGRQTGPVVAVEGELVEE